MEKIDLRVNTKSHLMDHVPDTIKMEDEDYSGRLGGITDLRPLYQWLVCNLKLI